MDILEWWHRRKTARHLRHEIRHVLALRADVADPRDLERLRRARERLDSAQSAGTAEAFQEACDAAVEALQAVRPPRRFQSLAENFEVIVVALAVAMAIRCFIVQPFKIPTGSMEPTLFGIQFQDQSQRRWWDRFPISWVGWAVLGEGFVEVRARNDGFFQPQGRQDAEGDWIVFIDQTPHRVRRNMPFRRRPGEYLRRGEVIASGRMRYGDHVLVNKIAYNFRRPERGDVIVFDTKGIQHPQIRKDTFYIKRLVGLPGETVSIEPPYLVVNGERVLDPPAFRRQVERVHMGVRGYTFADIRTMPRPKLATPDDELHLGPGEYLPMGDNSASSLDGRYFGGIPQRNLVGPAFAVYWPFTPRWGLISR